jgi:hypothetical protein
MRPKKKTATIFLRYYNTFTLERNQIYSKIRYLFRIRRGLQSGISVCEIKWKFDLPTTYIFFGPDWYKILHWYISKTLHHSLETCGHPLILDRYKYYKKIHTYYWQQKKISGYILKINRHIKEILYDRNNFFEVL